MDSSINDFWDVLLWSFWFFIWIAALMVWFRCLFDLFGDHTLSGWGKAGWALLLDLRPVARRPDLPDRTRAEHDRASDGRAQAAEAGSGRVHPAGRRDLGPADQIASAKALLDSGAIDQSEFDALKAKALA